MPRERWLVRILPILCTLALLTFVSVPRCEAVSFTDGFEGATFDPAWNRTGPGVVALSTLSVHAGNQSAQLTGSATAPWNAYLSQYLASEQSGSVSAYVRAAMTDPGAAVDLQIHLDNGGWANIQQFAAGGFWTRICPVPASPAPSCAIGVQLSGTPLTWHKFEIITGSSGITVKLDGATIATDPGITRFRSFGFELWGAPDAGSAFVDDVSAAVGEQTYDLVPPSLRPFVSNALGNRDRGVVFDVLQDVTITSAGVRIDPLPFGATAIQVGIWEVTPGGGYLDLGTRGASPLATATAPVADLGLTFYDVPIAFTFLKGHRYSVGFSQAAPSSGWGTNTNMEFYHFGLGQHRDPPNRDNQPFAIGAAFQVLNGAYGSDLSQSSLPHIRLSGPAVP